MLKKNIRVKLKNQSLQRTEEEIILSERMDGVFGIETILILELVNHH